MRNKQIAPIYTNLAHFNYLSTRSEALFSSQSPSNDNFLAINNNEHSQLHNFNIMDKQKHNFEESNNKRDILKNSIKSHMKHMNNKWISQNRFLSRNYNLFGKTSSNRANIWESDQNISYNSRNNANAFLSGRENRSPPTIKPLGISFNQVPHFPNYSSSNAPQIRLTNKNTIKYNTSSENRQKKLKEISDLQKVKNAIFCFIPS